MVLTLRSSDGGIISHLYLRIVIYVDDDPASHE